MFNQSAPFGVYGLGQMAGWPQYPVQPQLFHGYQQDPYGLLARTAWQNQQVANPWVIQALIGELVGAIARQGHVGFGPQGYGALGGLPLAQQLLGQQPLGQQIFGQLPIAAQLPSVIGNQWATQGSYGNGIGNLGIGAMGAGMPFATPVGNWTVPAPAMV